MTELNVTRKVFFDREGIKNNRKYYEFRKIFCIFIYTSIEYFD